jgi:hypothetical protein
LTLQKTNFTKTKENGGLQEFKAFFHFGQAISYLAANFGKGFYFGLDFIQAGEF